MSIDEIKMIDQSHVESYSSKRNEIILSVLIGLAYLYGVLSPQHYLPSVLDLYISLGVASTVCFGIILYLIRGKLDKLSYTSVLCIFFAAVIVIQPVINTIDYSGRLLFPVGSLLLMAVLSMVIANIKDKSILIMSLMLALYFGGIFTVISQLLQLLPLSYPMWLEPFIFTNGINNTRPYGNVGQPNQAAFIIAMAIVASGYLCIYVRALYHRFSLVLSIGFLLSLLFLAVGLGLTSSRGGLILAVVACIGLALIYVQHIFKKVAVLITLLSLFSLGNYFGTYLLRSYGAFKTSAMERIITSSTTRPLRWYQQEQAWQVFSHDWITGAGWGNLPKAILSHHESLNWFVFATHTHFLPTQLAAELGVLGLVIGGVLAFILIKILIKMQYSFENKVILTLIIINLLYASSEYPFWYIRFLLIFTCLMALADTSIIAIKFNIKPAIFVALAAIFSLSIFYIVSYRQYIAVDSLIRRNDVSAIEAQQLVIHLPNIYGFGYFKEVMLFKVIEVNDDNFDFSLSLGDRVINNYLDPNLMIKQATLLALGGKPFDSLYLYKAACHYNFYEYCSEVTKKLEGLSQSKPELFSDIFIDYLAWKDNQLTYNMN